MSTFVAVGSSFAAGPGLRPRADGSPLLAGRSAINYAHLAAPRLGLDLVDVTYSGATTADLLDPSSRGVPAQLDAVTPQTRLVTITAGGNDIGYLGAVTADSAPWPLRALPGARARLATLLDPETLDARFSALSGSLGDVIARIRERSPVARIVIVDYLTVLPPTGAGEDLGRLSPSTAAWARGVTARLTETYRQISAAFGCELLPVAEASRDHHAWSAEPWTNRFHLTLKGGAAYHPTAAGMRAVAELLAVTSR